MALTSGTSQVLRVLSGACSLPQNSAYDQGSTQLPPIGYSVFPIFCTTLAAVLAAGPGALRRAAGPGRDGAVSMGDFLLGVMFLAVLVTPAIVGSLLRASRRRGEF